jgi:hypothetical protein
MTSLKKASPSNGALQIYLFVAMAVGVAVLSPILGHLGLGLYSRALLSGVTIGIVCFAILAMTARVLPLGKWTALFYGVFGAAWVIAYGLARAWLGGN